MLFVSAVLIHSRSRICLEICQSYNNTGSPEGLILISLKECCINWIDKLTGESEGKQAKAKFLSSLSFLLGCDQKMSYTIRVDIFTHNKLIKKILYRSTYQLVIWLIPDTVKLTIKISHHNHLLHKIQSLQLQAHSSFICMHWACTRIDILIP